MRLGTKTDGKEGESSPLFRKCRGFSSVENSKHRIPCCVNIMKVYSFGTSGDGTHGSRGDFRVGSHHGGCRPGVLWTSRGGVCGRDVRTLLGLVHPQALPEILGSKDFFQGSGGPALQIVGNKLVIHVKYGLLLLMRSHLYRRLLRAGTIWPQMSIFQALLLTCPLCRI